MPTKYIDEYTWKRVEEKLVEAVRISGQSVEESDLLRLIIHTGLDKVCARQLTTLAACKGIGVVSLSLKGFPLPRLSSPDPQDCAELFREDAADLIVVYGKAGSGKSKLIEQIVQRLNGMQVEVFDSGEGGSAGDVKRALGILQPSKKVIASMQTRCHEDVHKEIVIHLLTKMP